MGKPTVEAMITLLAAAYLLWWAGAAMPGLAHLFRRMWLRRRPLGRAVLLRVAGGKMNRSIGWLVLSGFLIGGLGVIRWGGDLPLWVVVLMVAVGLALEELREPRALGALPGAVRFLEGYRAAVAQGHDLYGALASAGEALPPGPVSQAVDLALERQIRHRSAEIVFGSLGKANPFLQEATLSLRANGWKVSETIDTSLGLIQKRAVQALDQAGTKRVFFARAWPARAFFQAVIAGSLLAVLALRLFPAIAWTSLTAAAGPWGLAFAAAVLLRFGEDAGWLRRVAVAAILALGVVSYIASLPPTVPVQAFAPVPTFTATYTRTPVPPSPSPTSSVTPTITLTPRPLIRMGQSPVQWPSGATPAKRPRLYPPVWMNTKMGKNR